MTSIPIVEGEVILEAREAAAEAERILAQARQYSITDRRELQEASDERSRIKARYNEIEDLRKRLKAPILEAARNVDDQFKPALEELTQAVHAIDTAVKRFLDDEARRQREEEERLRAEARAEQERLAREAAVAEAKAEELRKEAEAARAAGELQTAARLESRAESAEAKAETVEMQARMVPTPILNREPPKVAGLSTRENWNFRIVDASKLPREYLIADEAAIRGVVKAMKGKTNIPGVEVYRDDTVAGTGRRRS